MPYFTPGDVNLFNQDPSGRSSAMLPLPMIFEAAEQPKWEYRTVTLDPREEPPLDESRLTELGAEGWLLAGIVQFPGGERVTQLIYYFVRFA